MDINRARVVGDAVAGQADELVSAGGAGDGGIQIGLGGGVEIGPEDSGGNGAQSGGALCIDVEVIVLGKATGRQNKDLREKERP